MTALKLDTRKLWLDPSWFDLNSDVVAALLRVDLPEQVEERRQANKAMGEKLRNAFEEGDARLLVESVPDYAALKFVEVNSDLLLKRDIYEASLLQAIVGVKENNHSWPMSTLKKMIGCGDKARFRAAGDPLPGAGPFTLYRGVAGQRKNRRVRGISWTGVFDRAVWFCRARRAAGSVPPRSRRLQS